MHYKLHSKLSSFYIFNCKMTQVYVATDTFFSEIIFRFSQYNSLWDCKL